MSQTDTSESPVILPPVNNGELQHAPADMTLMAMISRAANSGSVEALEKLIGLYERTMDRQREIAAKQAYAKMHHDMPQVEKKAKVDSTTSRGKDIKYGYASLEDIDAIARPKMKEHGFALTFRPTEQTDDYIVIEGELIHEATGWSFKARKREPIDKSAYMSLQQKGGSAQSYAIRYLTIYLLNIVVKGEDTDGRPRTKEPETKPESAPPSDKSVTNTWAIEKESHYAELGDDWYRQLMVDFGAAKSSEDLEALVDLVRENVNRLAKPKQNEIGAALMKARTRVQNPIFEHPVYNAQGETDGELFTNVGDYARELLEYWRAATNADDRENLLHHNADGLADAKNHRTPLLREIFSWQKDTAEPGWPESERAKLDKCSILDRQKVVTNIAKRCNELGLEKPEWLREAILPINAASNHQEWGEARIAELEWIINQPSFDAAVEAARKRMLVMKREDPAMFSRVESAFAARQSKL